MNKTSSIETKLGFFESTIIFSKREHSVKAHSPIDITDEGMVICVSESQPSKADSPIDTTDGGIVICVSDWQ